MDAFFSGEKKKVAGMVHLSPLPGSPNHTSWGEVKHRALEDARALEQGGVDALLVENFGDFPFHPDEVPRHTVAFFTAIALKIREEVDIPLGINVLRNDAQSALSIASAVGARFIRVNVLAGSYITDQGIIQGKPHELQRLKRQLGSEVEVLGDIRVKHAYPLGGFSIEEEVENVTQRAMADGVILTGKATGEPPYKKELRRARMATSKPVIIGSGLTRENIGLLEEAQGAIVGSYFKTNGEVDKRVDRRRVERLIREVKRI